MRQKMKSKQIELKEKLKKRLANSSVDDNEQTIVINRFKQFLEQWSKIKELLSLYKSNSFNQIEYICSENRDKYILDANKYEFNIPENLMIEYGHSIKHVNNNYNF
jgi:hypothetical protein